MKTPLLHLLIGGLVAPAILALVPAPAAERPAGYLFAHMTKADYGHLYYSISEDGLHWAALNNGERILGDEYLGHPDICRGPDGRYWLAGVGSRGTPPRMILWESSDLVTWTKGPELPGESFNVGERLAGAPYLGAPKLFFDEADGVFYLTWHAARRDLPPNRIHGVDEARWSDMRTFVMTSPDLKTWSEPKRLFQYDIATIDVIIRREGAKYYAILKDERYPTFDHPTGKSVRIATADSPAGPWSRPGPKISPNYHEAPTLIPRNDGEGWLIYHEQYPGVQYGISTARTLDGPWYDAWINIHSVTPEARHGCMIPLNAAELAAIGKSYGATEATK